MKKMQASLVLLGLLVGGGAHAGDDKKPDPAKIDFAHDIVPILKARCAECHTNGKYKDRCLSTRAPTCSRPRS
jgi:hypothetical protein